MTRAFLGDKLPALIAQDSMGALSSIDEFLTANPDLDKWDRVRLLSDGAALVYFSTPEAKRAAIANPSLNLINEALRAVKTKDENDPDFQAWEIKELSNNKIKILLAEKRAPDAVKVLDQWETLRPSYEDDIYLDQSGRWAEDWRATQNQLGHPDQAISGLVKAFQEGLLRRTTFAQGITHNIVAELLSQGKNEEALSWAKLTFAMCPFDKWAIDDATKDVNRCLTVGELTLAKVNAFTDAQTNPDAPNPLDGVKPPALDTATLQTQLAKTDLAPNARLLCLLAVGNYHEAMLQARTRLVADVGNQDNALQVARVFKAKDADIARANQFLTYYQAGQGDNPIPTFLKETEGAGANGNATP